MKIGILTHHYVNNYGAFLQAYSLSRAVAELFPEAEVSIVHYVNLKHLLINTAGCFRFYKERENFAAWRQKLALPGVFKRAQREFLPLTGSVNTPDKINELHLDALIIGSDEVWNYRDPKSSDSVKFGCGLTGSKLIAYAPSVGKAETFHDFPADMRDGLQRFSALSARDDLTAALIRETTGIEPARVPDPTFLKKPPSSRTRRVQELTGQPYILFYHCARLPETTREALKKAAAQKGLRLLGAGEYDRMYDEVSVDLTPFEWCALFESAQFVITGTFHGAVFALLNGKPLAACPDNPTRAAKMCALLEEFSLGGRIFNPYTVTAEQLLCEDGTAADGKDILAVIRARGLKYLYEALKE